MSVDHGVYHRYRKIGSETGSRIDHLQLRLLVFASNRTDLRFERDQHIAKAPLDESRGRAASAGIKHRYVAEYLADKCPRLGVVLAIGPSA